MKEPINSFILAVSKTNKGSPTGELARSRYLEKGKFPVLSCEGACMRGEIARLASNKGPPSGCSFCAQLCSVARPRPIIA